MDMLAREEVQNSTTSFGQKSQGNWIMGAIRKGSMELYEAAITMLESAILNMEDAQRRLESNPQQENIDPQIPQVKVTSKERSKLPQPLGSGVMATMSSFKSLNVASARSGGGGNRVPSPRMQDSNRAPQQSYGFALSSGRKTHESNQSLGTYGEEPYFKGTARFQQH
ncbi:hypothetical protein FGO68_gene9290 [Halteria grandinella]|uniref:Uncharacterized protein n=1 Tax=Halteria grandinella TaxID=5974 RepID=A0A8J8T3F0_HALGN|nr:hypothetical protein FGO68_gene9290 [Halteria grandinella]